MRKYPTQQRLQELFSLEDGKLIYRVAPYQKPALLGREVGHQDKRDFIWYVKVDGVTYVRDHLISIYQSGEAPPRARHHSALTHARLLEALDYDEKAGTFIRKCRGHGVRVGDRADYLEPNGYPHVNVDGHRYLASRLAWFYVNGEWPKRPLFPNDGNNQNVSISNLSYSEWDLSIPAQKNEYDRRHRKTKPEHFRNSQLKRDFGISLDQYQVMFVEQNGVCGICSKPETSVRNGRRKWLAVDHDHADDTIRGLLCTRCNQMLGYAEDRVEIFTKAISYLEAHASKPKTNVIPLTGRKRSA